MLSLPQSSVVGKAPARSLNPATLLGDLLVAIEPCHALPASPSEGIGQRALRHLVTASGAGKDRNRRNPVGEIVVTATIDSKDSTRTRYSLRRGCTKALI